MSESIEVNVRYFPEESPAAQINAKYPRREWSPWEASNIDVSP
ncbi:MAG TPA: hypothetical protein VGU64_13680 [Terriglobales bacterium]|nr:hypothetical protein [Terriglobales bacterium]